MEKSQKPRFYSFKRRWAEVAFAFIVVGIIKQVVGQGMLSEGIAIAGGVLVLVALRIIPDRFPLAWRCTIAVFGSVIIFAVLTFAFLILTTPDLIYAALNGNTKQVNALLDEGEKIDEKGRGGFTALIAASIGDQTDTVRMLLEKGAKINEKDDGGTTALMFAAQFGRIDVVKLLLEKGADVNARDNEDQTALMIAEKINKLNHENVVNLLKTYQKK